MYLNFFGLQDKPFSIAPDPKFLFMTDQHRDALAHLLFGVGDEGGFVLLTGEIGTGKTTICRRLLAQLEKNVNVAFIINPRLSASELLQSICDEFQIDYGKNESIKFLIDLVNKFLLDSHSEGKNTILIIDEAQNLSDEVLEQLRLLTNLETNEKKLLQLILLGQPELNIKLDQYNLRQLAQRVTARFHLKSLSEKQMISYVKHRLHVAGFRGNIFEDAAFRYIFKQSKGVPRLINVICDRALLGAYTKDQITVTKRIVEEACKEVLGNLKTPNNKIKYFYKKIFILSSLILLFTLLIIYAYDFFLINIFEYFFDSKKNNIIA